MKDLGKLFLRKLRQDKFLVVKVVIYSAYMVLSCKKAVACYRLLLDQIRNRNKSTTSQTLLCLLYLGIVFIQFFVFSTNEVSYFYKVLKQNLRLVCYEITFKNKQTQTSPTDLQQSQEEYAAHRRIPSVQTNNSRIVSRRSSFNNLSLRGHTSGLFNIQANQMQDSLNQQFIQDQIRFMRDFFG